VLKRKNKVGEWHTEATREREEERGGGRVSEESERVCGLSL